MAFSTPDTILTQVVTLLTNAMPTANIWREPTVTLEVADLPAILVTAEEDKPTDVGSLSGTMSQERILTINVDVTTTGFDAIKTLEPLSESILSVLFKSHNLDGYVNKIHFPSRQWGRSEANKEYIVCRLTFDCYYQYKAA